jgi:hypothetical protein
MQDYELRHLIVMVALLTSAILTSTTKAMGTFGVSLDDRDVVGTVALLDIGNQRAALRKMFVTARRRGAEHSVARWTTF